MGSGEKLAGLATAGLCLLWIALGLTGHEPWKPDEAYSFGLVLHIVQSGDWVMPTLGGEPFLEKPPAFFITAAWFARLAGDWLPLHDAARLATGFYLALTLLFLALTADELGDRKGRLQAPLIFISCFGLFELSHRLQTDISLMAGVGLALYALALIPRRPVLGGLLLGSGAGLAFLSKGLIGPGLIGVTTLGLTIFPHWRQRRYFQSWLWALAAALPWLLIWPALLYQRSPEQFHVWLWVNNISRFAGGEGSGLGPAAESWYYSKTLPWFAWPALPLGLWAVWRAGRSGRLGGAPALQLPLTAFLLMLACLALAHDARSNYALPLLVPAALLGGQGAAQLGERGQRWWYRSGVALFGTLSVVLWLGWLGLLLGAPPRLAERLQRLEPGYVEQLRPGAVLLALALTLAWLLVLAQKRRADDRAAWSWAAGFTLAWGLVSTLWLPFVDHGRSYRGVMTELGGQLAGARCVASLHLGEPQRALLEYYAGWQTLRREVHPDADCPLLLTQGRDAATAVSPLEWQPVWRGSRPGDETEIYQLFRRVTP